MTEKPTTSLTYEELTERERRSYHIIKLGEDVGQPLTEEAALRQVADMRSRNSFQITDTAAEVAWAAIAELRKTRALTFMEETRVFGIISDGVRRAVQAVTPK